jgi:type I restriction enzyme S subunit
MQEEKQLVPQLRFSEFEGEWIMKKFRKIVDINPKNKELPNSFIYIDLESVNNGNLLKEERIFKVDAPSRAQRLLSKKDILYQTVRPYQKNNYFFDKAENDYVASTGYAQIRTSNNSTSFLYQYIHTNYFVNKVLLRCTGTSYPAINSTDLSKIKVATPLLSEQQKIANFLTAIDKRIHTLEKKKTLLEQYKKGVMHKIFKQELRFKDDTSTLLSASDGKVFPEWEEKKLGQTGNIKKGKQLNKEELTLSGTYPCQNGGISPSGYTEEYNTVGNTITISEGGNSCGYVNYMQSKFWCGGHCYSILELKKEVNALFLFQYLKFNEYGIMRLRVGSGLPNIQKKDLLMFEVKLPCIEEQTKIANFLSAIDRNIELVTKKIEHTKTYKKGLLQQMFV